MNYNQTLEFLFSSLVSYQEKGPEAYKPGLERITAFCKHLGNPQRNYFTIHVAGTNGKGSVSHMLASVLQQAGYRTGLYTSPHLRDFRERILVDGEMIPKQKVVNFVDKHYDCMKELGLSFFEMSTALAFDYFDQSDVEVAVIETGLGGRLDATNLIIPIVSVITNIGLDHMALLGDTLPKIAAEKAGIIKPNVPAIVGTRDADTDFVFIGRAKECGTTLEFASDNWNAERTPGNTYNLKNKQGITFDNLHPDLKGLYQRKNIPAVLETVLSLRAQGINISDQHIHDGIANTIRYTGLLGRWQELSRAPYTVCDTGHNIDGLTEIAAQLETCKYERLHFVMGMVNDKDVDSVLHILPKDAIYYFCKASIPRAMDEHVLAEKAAAHHLHGKTYPTVAEAYAAAKAAATPDDMIYIGGSTFVVAEVI